MISLQIITEKKSTREKNKPNRKPKKTSNQNEVHPLCRSLHSGGAGVSAGGGLHLSPWNGLLSPPYWPAPLHLLHQRPRLRVRLPQWPGVESVGAPVRLHHRTGRHHRAHCHAAAWNATAPHWRAYYLHHRSLQSSAWRKHTWSTSLDCTLYFNKVAFFTKTIFLWEC